MHWTVLHSNHPKSVSKVNKLIDKALSIAMHAMRSNVHTTLGSSQGALVFNRDMCINIPLLVNWHAIITRNYNTQRTCDQHPSNCLNTKRQHLTMLQFKKYLKTTWSNQFRYLHRSSYKINQVHVYGIVIINLQPWVTERINIWRVIPCHDILMKTV